MRQSRPPSRRAYKIINIESLSSFMLALCLSFYSGYYLSLVYRIHNLNCKKEMVNLKHIGEVVVKSSKLAKISMSRKSRSKMIHNAVETNKSNFLHQFDFGIPINEGRGMQHSFIFHNSNVDFSTNQYDNGRIPYNADSSAITKDCITMNVIMIKGGSNECLAIVDGPDSYYHHLWKRSKDKNGDYSTLLPSGRSFSFAPPIEKQTDKHQTLLGDFFETMETNLEQLQNIAEQISNDDNEIIVLTSNFGQSALLMNFVCHSRAKGFDISNVLLFPTDRETLELGKGLGLSTFFDEKIFESYPHQEANSYGDRTFVSMMLAKVISVNLINMLGYNVLFQDLDVIWYKHPLSNKLFTDPTSSLSHFDILFQEDGSHSTRYSPYSANSGFYYVRHNARTRYLFTQMLYHGVNIIQSGSHQQVLISLLNEHASLFGLRVKVLSRDEFPGGWQFHRKRDMMKDIVTGKLVPWIFHMSWTLNKTYKLEFMKQMGYWFVNDKCEDKDMKTINESTLGRSDETMILSRCCSVEPLIQCFYRDKPSIKPCIDSPQFFVNGYTFAKSVNFW